MTRALHLMRSLSEARKAWGLSQADLAELAGRSVSALQHSEQSEKPVMSVEAFCDFADAMGYDVVLMFRGSRR